MLEQSCPRKRCIRTRSDGCSVGSVGRRGQR